MLTQPWSRWEGCRHAGLENGEGGDAPLGSLGLPCALVRPLCLITGRHVDSTCGSPGEKKTKKQKSYISPPKTAWRPSSPPSGRHSALVPVPAAPSTPQTGSITPTPMYISEKKRAFSSFATRNTQWYPDYDTTIDCACPHGGMQPGSTRLEAVLFSLSPPLLSLPHRASLLTSVPSACHALQVSVIHHVMNETACCAACQAWNDARPAHAPDSTNCTIAVWQGGLALPTWLEPGRGRRLSCHHPHQSRRSSMMKTGSGVVHVASRSNMALFGYSQKSALQRRDDLSMSCARSCPYGRVSATPPSSATPSPSRLQARASIGVS